MVSRVSISSGPTYKRRGTRSYFRTPRSVFFGICFPIHFSSHLIPPSLFSQPILLLFTITYTPVNAASIHVESSDFASFDFFLRKGLDRRGGITALAGRVAVLKRGKGGRECRVREENTHSNHIIYCGIRSVKAAPPLLYSGVHCCIRSITSVVNVCERVRSSSHTQHEKLAVHESPRGEKRRGRKHRRKERARTYKEFQRVVLHEVNNHDVASPPRLGLGWGHAEGKHKESYASECLLHVDI